MRSCCGAGEAAVAAGVAVEVDAGVDACFEPEVGADVEAGFELEVDAEAGVEAGVAFCALDSARAIELEIEIKVIESANAVAKFFMMESNSWVIRVYKHYARSKGIRPVRAH